MIKEKITRHLKAFRLLKSQYNDLKNNKDYLTWYYQYRPELRQFKDAHLGADCFIIGNGPSLNKMDLSPLNNYYCFGLNKIHLIFEKTPLQLTYHVAVNPLVIEQMEEQLNSNVFNCPSFLSYTAAKQLCADKSLVYRLMTEDGAPWSFYKDISDKISEGHTVTFVALQLAFYMGFKNVYLIGVDHNFKQQGDPNEEQVLTSEDCNHFHPDYFKGQKWHLADLEGNEASYALAKHQFHRHGREIYDATVDGKLNIFTKISWQEALALALPKSN